MEITITYSKEMAQMLSCELSVEAENRKQVKVSLGFPFKEISHDHFRLHSMRQL